MISIRLRESDKYNNFIWLRNSDKCNFLKYKVDVLVVESTDTNLKKLEMSNQSLDFITKSKIYNLIIKNSYKFVNWIHSDLVFVRNYFRQA